MNQKILISIGFYFFFSFVILSNENPVLNVTFEVDDQEVELFSFFTKDIEYGLFTGDGDKPYYVDLESPFDWIEAYRIIEPVSSSFNEGPALDVIVVDDFLYALTSGFLKIFNLSNLENSRTRPRLISEILIEGNSGAMFVEGDYVFVSSLHLVITVDITNKEVPIVCGTEDLSTIARSLIVKDGYLYVAAESFIWIASLGNMCNPLTHKTFTHVTKAYDLVFSHSNDILYVSVIGGYNPSDGYISGIVAIQVDTVDPNIQEEDILNYTTEALGNMFLDETNDLLYVADCSSDYGFGEGRGLVVFDVSEPSEILFLSSYVNDELIYSKYTSVVVKDGVAFVGAIGGINVLSVIDPYNIVPTSYDRDWMFLGLNQPSLPEPHVMTLSKNSDYLILAAYNSGFVFLDVSNPEKTTFHSEITVRIEALQDIKISGDYAYLVCGHSIKVMDISDPYNPFQVGAFYCNNSRCSFSSIDIHENYAYVGDNSFGNGNGKMVILDISDPFHPMEVLTYPYDGNIIIDCESIKYFNGSVFCTNPSQLKVNIIDVSDLDDVSDIAIGILSTPKQLDVFRLLEEGYDAKDFLLVADGDSGLKAYDVTPGFGPIFTDEYSRTVDTVSVQGDYAYISGPSIDLVIMDISDPYDTLGSDRVVGVFSTTGGKDTVLDDNFLYYVLPSRLVVVDITNKTRPVELSNVGDCSGYYNSVAARGQFLFAGTLDPGDGFQVYRRGKIVIDANVPTYSYDDNICGNHNITIFAKDIDDGVTSTSFILTIRGSVDFVDREKCVLDCNGVMSNSSEVCNSRGHCIWTLDVKNGTCQCYDGFYGDNCDVYECFGFFSNDSSNVCKGRGNCVDLSPSPPEENRFMCNCTPSFSGFDCWKYYCYEIEFNSSSVCSGHGTCQINTGECYPCYENYFGKYCNHTTCDDILFNDSSVCNTHGECLIDSRNCSCVNESYFGEFCGMWMCGDTVNTDKYVCGGHGECIELETCVCDWTYYSGEYCEKWSCFGLDVKDREVCGSHGSCLDKDKCFCLSGYSSLLMFGNCTEFYCDSLSYDDPSVCNSRGECVLSQQCNCTNNYEGQFCETWSCGFDKDDENTCSGHGECKLPNECKCKAFYTGDFCENDIILPIVLVPILSLAAIFFLICLLCILFCCYCLFCVVSVCICTLVSVGGYQKIKVGKYGKLRNFKLLLHEQELEEGSIIAHLRMNHSIFEIDMDDIKILELLGEGGSNSMVFKASYHGKFVAFKAFKTRLICSSQDSYEDFEREVEVLASVSHPSIVQFFGATVKQPRIGIVMEFCEKGDIVQYIFSENKRKREELEIVKKKSEINDNDFDDDDDDDDILVKKKNKILVMVPLRKKMKMLMEVIDAMEYLHSRSIIHRDLKLENVLVDKLENCKLMDFGLSTIVERMSQAKTTRVEVLTQNCYSEKCDVFSFAIFIYIFITEIFEPYAGKTDVHIEVKVASDPNFRPYLKPFNSIIPKSLQFLQEIMIKCWDNDPDQRYGFDEISKIFEEKMKTIGHLENVEYCLQQNFGENSLKKKRISRVGLYQNNEEKEIIIKEVENELRMIRAKFFEMKKKMKIINNGIKE